MYDWVLRLKHWQFFVIGFVVPGLCGLGALAWWVSRILKLEASARSPTAVDPASVFDSLTTATLWMYGAGTLTLVLTGGWLGAIVSRLGPLAAPEEQPRGPLFKVLHLTLLLGSVCFVGIWYWSMSTSFGPFGTVGFADSTVPPPDLRVWIAAFIAFYALAFVLLGINLYVAIAAARVYVSAQRPYYRDSTAVVVAVIAMLYWPVGIWFLQPKINVLAQAADDYARTGIPPLPLEPRYY